ncbi:hypothetical protein [Sinomonas halotolerans]|uniref:Alpha/beta hydrolase n=1 Tax=Sinomonas halotolerans TaxID=1644133 RepID=A0ABU9X0U0_9MICC
MSLDGKDEDWRRERDPAGFIVTGGAAFAVNTSAMAAAEGELAAAARDLESSRQHLESARRSVARGSCSVSPSAARFDLVAWGVARGVSEARGGAGALARETSLARDAYAAEEARRATETGGLQSSGLWLATGIPPSLAVRWPGLFEAVSLDRPVGDAARVARAVAGFGPVAGSPADRISVVRRDVPPAPSDPSTFSAAAQSLRQAQGTAPLEDGSRVPPSSVVVDRIPRPDGTTAVVLTVPGTQEWELDAASGNVFDAEGNADALAGAESHARQLIERALADQRLRDGDTVVVNAHSQGSLHVFGLLEDRGFRERWPVAAVTVFGGAPRQFDIPDDVQVLSVSNVDDVLPAISAEVVTPRPNVVDVVTPAHRDAARGLDLGDAGGTWDRVVNGHSIDRYAIDAQALDRSTDPSVLAYAGVLGAAMGGAAVGAVGAAGGAPSGAGAPGGTAAGVPAASSEARAARGRERIIYTGADTVTGAAARR